jgi:hypothetical protein
MSLTALNGIACSDAMELMVATVREGMQIKETTPM